MAITLVLMRHFFDLFMKGYEGFLAPFFSWGWHGVDLFFALSGFLIGGQIIEECRHREFSFRRFFIKRSFRILPPYFFAIAVFVAFFSYANGFLILENSRVFSDFMAHVLYLQDYIQSGQMMYNGIYWSLAVEEKFYSSCL
jgi:peptidoglycan/LPS O-acetylase OafA/YrhL